MDNTTEEVLGELKNNDIKFVDFRFSDVNGTVHHITRSTGSLSADVLNEGIFFDGSSIPGLRSVENSDMIALPDLSTYFIDAFTAQQTAVFICDIIDPETNKPYANDPRVTAKSAALFLLESQIADKAFFGPEIEFFVFDKVQFHLGHGSSSFSLGSQEMKDEELGYVIQKKMGYMPTAPLDSLHDIRSEMLSMMGDIGIEPVIHHHEVATSQCEIGFMYSDLVGSADNVQKAKNVIKNVAYSYGKSATFMPKPIEGDNGSGMHCHQSIWKNGSNLFVNPDGSMSQLCKYYIGGILKHIKAINAITNPSINSYKRLLPGYEAPTIASYGTKNRSACIRVPCVTNNNAFRIEARFPDTLCNPYLSFTALLMAGIDGIINKIDPGNPAEVNCYNLSEEEMNKVGRVSSSFQESLNSLNNDRDFLKIGDVFSDAQIDSFIKLKSDEICKINEYISPAEFVFYYNR